MRASDSLRSYSRAGSANSLFSKSGSRRDFSFSKNQRSHRNRKRKKQMSLKEYFESLPPHVKKHLKYYPEVRGHRDDIVEFFANTDAKDFTTGQPLNPDTMDYAMPDFGFDNKLAYEMHALEKLSKTDEKCGWKFLMDTVAAYPKYERVQNYIKFIKSRKEMGLLTNKKSVIDEA